MFTFLYYVTIFYFSIFCLTIVDKINKGEIKTKAELKTFLLGKSITVLSKYHRLKRISNNTFQRCIKYKREDDNSDNDEEDKRINLFIFTQDKKLNLKVTIDNDKIKLNGEYPLEKDLINETLYIENDSFLKELKDFKLNEDILKFLNGDLLTDKKLFINVELMNGKLRDSESFDITNAVQQYFVEKNEILSQSFLEKILKFNFDTKLNDNYSVNIMTRDVEMVHLTSTKKINLIRSDENTLSYEILENDDKNI